MNPVKALSAAAPGPALVIIGKWLNLFSTTIVAYPEWQADATNLALAIGTVFAIALPFAVGDVDKARVRIFGALCLLIMFVFVMICLFIWFHLGPPDPGQTRVNVPLWHDIWELVYISAMVLLIVAITLLTLSIDDRHNVLFWFIAAIAIFVVVVVIVLGIVHFSPTGTA